MKCKIFMIKNVKNPDRKVGNVQEDTAIQAEMWDP